MRTLPLEARAPERPSMDPHAGVKVFADYRGELRARCEVLVVGSGPSGAVVAKELAEAGRDVILLEEGPPFGLKDFRQEAGESMSRMLREGGMRTTRGQTFIPTMQAIALGGGSVMNSAICARSPAWVFDKWGEVSGTSSITREALDPHYERVEAFLGVEPTAQEVMGRRNLLFKQGCDALGLSSEPTFRNVRGCKGSAECFTGCRHGAKRSMDVSYVPAAIRAGARVFSSVRAERLIMEGRRAVGMRGRVVEPFTGRETHMATIHADTVVLAAGCMATPLLLLRSGVGNSSGYVGRELQLHPGLAVMAVFPERIDPWAGATQGYHSLHFLEEGLKLEVLWSPPAVLAARFPGLGHELQRYFQAYDRMAPFDVIIAAERSRGSVRLRRGTLEPDIRFDLDQRDVERLQRGLGYLSDICWAAGAEAVMPGLFGVPDLLKSREEAEVLRQMKLTARHTITAGNHAFGTARMSHQARDGVVDEWGRCHETENVYVADTSVFPGSPAVNPMLTCMALADRIARGIAVRW
ncbi:FAD-dependent oxidoreductase [Chondromyces crocatus]|uniref:Choline dehydrogenase n=1 Tax=Chondromyces crocatus TaxID=52 RepID=A0A0K1EKK8_CHOCO|nr:GMC family oxidoreductase [Chondromyces crocatus]AKT41386.1 choline dehydrogenase [Chondromyces crocatus]